MRTFRKNIILGLFILQAFFVYAQDNSGLKAYLPMNGNANDITGNGYNGTVNGAVLTQNMYGQQNSAYYFDGIDDNIEILKTNAFDFNKDEDFSISLWVYIEEKSTGHSGILANGGGSISKGWNLRFEDRSFVFEFNNGVEAMKLLTIGQNEILMEQWINLIFVADRDGLGKLYLNGIKVAEDDISAYNVDLTNSRTFEIGRWLNSYFKGGIADLKVYNKVLTLEDINNIYNNVGNPESFLPSYDQNYIQIVTPIKPYFNLPADRSYESVEQIQYFDGMGREVQNVMVKNSPNCKDVIEYIAYDEIGRETKKFLPYVSANAGGLFDSNAEDNQYRFYDQAVNPKENTKIATDVQPWADIQYEPSPLNRIERQGAPGKIWRVNKEGGEDYAVHFLYETNANTDEIKRFDVENNILVLAGTYNANILYKTKTRDENGIWNTEYKNTLGEVILKEADTEERQLKTYYVYDDFGLLRYILPPKAVEELGTETSFNINTPIIKNFCYYYEYDQRKRMVLKQLPGAAPVYMVYDNRDRLVLTQDGNLRNQNKWMFTKYDMLNRPVITGIYQNTEHTSRQAMQEALNTFIETTPVYFENKTGNYADDYFGYTNQSFPVLDAQDEILNITYYDNYEFDQVGVKTYASIKAYAESIDNIDYPRNKINNKVKGMLTGTYTKILGTTDEYLLSVSFYDDKYRVIRSYAENYLGGYDLLLNKYDYIGNILKTKQVHYKDKEESTMPVVINQRYIYDHANRLLEVYHDLENNSSGEVLLAQMEYNQLGQLVKKKLNENVDGSFLQEVDYEYNIRGWNTKINDPANLGDDLFAMELGYHDNLNLGAAPQYNGNISAIKWANKEETGSHGYGFAYDAVNRLTKGSHYKNTTPTQDFSLANVSYDQNGNITALSRYGNAGKHIDDLSYTYTGNQLENVSDIATGKEDGFKDGANTTNEYGYDPNGNMVYDDNKGIDTIYYNYLNLPEEIDFGGENKIYFVYDAAGNKLAKYVDGTETNSDQYYVGNMEYNHAQELEYIYTDEGRIRVSATEYHYDYYLKDHLGNTRVVFSENATTAGQAEALQVNNYYPFGLRFNQAPVYQSEENNYLYNGKELQPEYGYNMYSYGARFYDPALARFHTIDPKAETYSYQTPYSYAVNNPIIFVDKNGEGPVIPNTLYGTQVSMVNEMVSLQKQNPGWGAGKVAVVAMKNQLLKAATFTDVGDATVLTTMVTRGGDAINVDGTKADGFDKAGAIIGAAAPFIGGKAISKLLRKGADAVGLTKKADNVLKETVEGVGNFTSKEVLGEGEALDAGIEFVGKDASEIGKSGSGVYRSNTTNADGTVNQFRMDNNSLEGKHAPNKSHVHYEVVKEGKKKPVVNNHVKIKED